MGSLTIRNLDDDVKHRLRVRAAEHGRSMEEEVRTILSRAVTENSTSRNLVETIKARTAPLGGVDLEIPSRGPMREPPDFSRD